MNALKILICSFYLLLCLTNLQAQDARPWQIGIESGVGVSRYYGNEFSNSSELGTPTWHSRAFVLYQLKPRIGFFGGLGYEKKGSNYLFQFRANSSPTFSQGSIDQYLDYLCLPVGARFSFGTKTQFFLQGGLYFGYLFNAYERITGEHMPASTNSTYEYFKRIDAGLITGLGVNRKIGDLFAVKAELRFNTGLLHISKVDTYFDGKLKNFGYDFGLGLAYTLK